ncbi:glycosyltransferase [Cellulosimicrobium sp. NPDC057127]|uniref:glycosyltransferase n=1 Tax=Cellulosimicrobium sp. NPDC057127 TaxID=3346026 RepID=UPI0036288074
MRDRTDPTSVQPASTPTGRAGSTRRVAVTIGTLRVPPTYFALQHAVELAEVWRFQVFALAADVRDPALAALVRDLVPFRSATFRRREMLIPAAIPAMVQALHRFDPQVIHQHFATWSWPAVSAARRTGAPLVTTLHGIDVFTAVNQSSRVPMLRWHQANIERARASSTRFLAVSHYLADAARRAGFPTDRLEVHYQGIDTDFFTPLELRPASRPPRIVFVGQLNEAKGVRDLLEASEALSTRIEHEVEVVGTGPLMGEIAAEADRNPRVRVRGRLSRDEIRDSLRVADLLVLPTQEHEGRREAAGLVLLEAQACGTPVVAYRSGGTPEMLDDGRTGLLVDERDRHGLADAIASVLALDSTERELMRRAARDFVVAQRSVRSSARLLDEHYRDLTS